MKKRGDWGSNRYSYTTATCVRCGATFVCTTAHQHRAKFCGKKCSDRAKADAESLRRKRRGMVKGTEAHMIPTDEERIAMGLEPIKKPTEKRKCNRCDREFLPEHKNQWRCKRCAAWLRNFGHCFYDSDDYGAHLTG